MGKPLARKVLVIGWDAADWKVINPLLDAGKMPALERFITQGVMGNIATLNPPLSPMIWTTVATGVRPYRHGIHGFTEPNPDIGGIQPVTNLSRKVKAVWNILNQSGYRCNVIGWWPSAPAEPIDGVMVSNHFQRAAVAMGKPWRLPAGTVHPPERTADLARLRIHPAELTAGQLLPFIPRAAEIDQEKDPRLGMVAKILAECSSVHACATAVMQLEPWDFMAVYYDAIDHFGHGFMKYHPPRQARIPERDFELYSGVVEAGYRFHDMMLEALMTLAGEDATIIIVSDHGFHPDDLRPAHIPAEPAGPAVEHSPYGIVAIKGPGIKRDERIYGASVLDITPTVLNLFGLPLGDDMQGKPLVQAFAEPPPIETIPTWEEVPGDDGRHPPEMHLDPAEAREALRQLVDLGYIEDPGDDKEQAVAKTLRENRYNLAQSYADANRYLDAAAIFEELWAGYPDELRFGHHLIRAYQALGRLKEARRIAEDLIETRKRLAVEARRKLQEYAAKRQQDAEAEPSDAEKQELRLLRQRAFPGRYGDDFLLGRLLAAEGKSEEALEHLRRAEQAQTRQPALHLQIGHIYIKMKRWAAAERAFGIALKLDPQSAQAHYGLCLSQLPQRRNHEAAEHALAAVGLLFHYPQAHYRLGVALHRLGHLEWAVEALQVALAQNPNFAEAHRRLAHIYARRHKEPEKARYHREQARDVRRLRRDRKAGKMLAAMASRAAQEAHAGEEASGRPQEMPPAPSVSKEGAQGLPEAAAPPAAGPGAEGPFTHDAACITVVSGLPRSGTSLMMQMLAAGGLPILSDAQRAADADNPKGYFELESAKRLHKDKGWLDQAVGKAVKIVAQLLPKLPGNYYYRVIFMERDLKEVLASQKVMLGRLEKQEAKLTDEQLQRVYTQQIRRVKLWLGKQANVRTLFVNHRDAVNDPGGCAERLCTFLGGERRSDRMAAVVDATLYRQRK